jgi:hypothetical protein
MLLTLPTEILLLIFDYVGSIEEYHERRKNNKSQAQQLWGLSLTSRRLNLVVSPLLYKKIAIRDFVSCKSLLRTLHEKKHLGLNCISLELHDDIGELLRVECNRQCFSNDPSDEQLEALDMIPELADVREIAKWTMQRFGYQGIHSIVEHCPFPIGKEKVSSFQMIDAFAAYLCSEPSLPGYCYTREAWIWAWLVRSTAI